MSINRSTEDNRPSVGIVYPRLHRGGSEAHAVWGLQALRGQYRTCFLTCDDVDLGPLNEFYGTALADGEFTVLPPPLPRWIRRGHRLSVLREAVFYRHVAARARELDVLISTHNCLNVGVPAIQYIADLYFDDDLSLQYLHRSAPPIGLLQKVYHTCVGAVFGTPRTDLMARDMILVNSRWTGQIITRKFGVPVQVLYPPVAACPVPVSLEGRENGFVCLGRLVPEKKIEQMVAIVGQLRQRGHDVHLHIAGGLDGSPYCQRLQDLCRGLDWVRLEGLLSGVRKWEMLARHRYGLHACPGEAFGIVVAEMMVAGCVVFVPAGGGPDELVNMAELSYRDEAEAMHKIARVLNDPAELKRLHIYMLERGRQFRAERFMAELRGYVEQFLQQKCRSTVGAGVANP